MIILHDIVDVTGTTHLVNPFQIVSLRLTGGTVEKKVALGPNGPGGKHTDSVIRVQLTQGFIDVAGFGQGPEATYKAAFHLGAIKATKETI